MLAPADVPPTAAPRGVRLGDGSAERGTGDDTAQLELVAAGHEDAGGLGERLDESRVVGVLAVLRPDSDHAGRTERGEQGGVHVDHVRAERGGGRNHHDPRFGPAGRLDELLQDQPLLQLVLGSTDGEQGPGPARRHPNLLF